MSVKKRLSRKWRLEVDTGTGSPTWTPVSGRSKLELTIEGITTDTTDFDSDGWSDEMVTGRKWSLACEAWDGYTGPDAAPVEDPGQAALKAKGLLIGTEAQATIRIYRSDTMKGYTGVANVSYKGAGGEVQGVEKASFDFSGSGSLTPVTVP